MPSLANGGEKPGKPQSKGKSGARAETPTKGKLSTAQVAQDSDPQEKIRQLEKRERLLESKLRQLSREQVSGPENLEDDTADDEQIRSLEAQIAELEDMSQQSEQKADRFGRAQGAIVDLYLEIRSRVAGKGKTTAERADVEGQGEEEHKDALLQKDSVLLVESMTSTLRQLFAFRKRHEAELEKTAQRNHASFEDRLASQQQELNEVREALQAKQRERAELQRKVEDMEKLRFQETQKNSTMLEQLRERNSGLQEKVKFAQEETQMLNSWNTDNMRHIQEQDEKLQKVPQLEKQLQGIVQKAKLDHERMRKRQVSKLRGYEKELDDMKKTEQKNEKLKMELQELRTEVNALKSDSKHGTLVMLQEEVKKMEALLRERQAKIRSLEDQLTKLRLKLEKKEDEVQQCTKEYGRAYAALKKHMSEEKDETLAAADGVQGGSQKKGPYINEILRKKLQEKEEELQRLNGKFKHFLVVEKKMAIQKQAFEEERQRYEEEIDGYRLKLTSANEKVDKMRRASLQSQPATTQSTPQLTTLDNISSIAHASDVPGGSKAQRKRPGSASLQAVMASRPRASVSRPSSAVPLR
jgi:chromosome segregation ATPase